jgi:hypothetical protein
VIGIIETRGGAGDWRGALSRCATPGHGQPDVMVAITPPWWAAAPRCSGPACEVAGRQLVAVYNWRSAATSPFLPLLGIGMASAAFTLRAVGDARRAMVVTLSTRCYDRRTGPD